MKTYTARVAMPNGSFVDAQIQANNVNDAKRLLEAQYGAGKVSSVREVR